MKTLRRLKMRLRRNRRLLTNKRLRRSGHMLSRNMLSRKRHLTRRRMRGGSDGVAATAAGVNVGGVNIAYNDGGDASYQQIASHIRGGEAAQNAVNRALTNGRSMSGGSRMSGGSGGSTAMSPGVLNPGDPIVVPQFRDLPFTGAINVNSNMLKLYQNHAQAVINATNDHLAGKPPS